MNLVCHKSGQMYIFRAQAGLDDEAFIRFAVAAFRPSRRPPRSVDTVMTLSAEQCKRLIQGYDVSFNKAAS